jgi:hypothetical protein
MPRGIPKKKKHKKTGPKGPTKLNKTTIQKLEAAFALDATVDEACYYADISRTSYYEWIKAHPELFDKFERLRNKPVLAARQSVVKGIAKDPNLALKYLERKRNKEFNTKQIVEGTVVSGKMSKKQSARVTEILKENGL